MSGRYLATYLNDHLAGSVTALELLEWLANTHASSPLGKRAGDLRSDIEADQRELKDLIEKLDTRAGVVRRAAAWLAEKMAEVKLKADDPSAGSLRLLETMEIVSLGIEGKRGLWLALRAASASNPAISGPDYDRLIRRAEEQRSRAEGMRLEAALVVLGACETQNTR